MDPVWILFLQEWQKDSQIRQKIEITFQSTGREAGRQTGSAKSVYLPVGRRGGVVKGGGGGDGGQEEAEPEQEHS